MRGKVIIKFHRVLNQPLNIMLHQHVYFYRKMVSVKISVTLTQSDKLTPDFVELNGEIFFIGISKSLQYEQRSGIVFYST